MTESRFIVTLGLSESYYQLSVKGTQRQESICLDAVQDTVLGIPFGKLFRGGKTDPGFGKAQILKSAVGTEEKIVVTPLDELHRGEWLVQIHVCQPEFDTLLRISSMSNAPREARLVFDASTPGEDGFVQSLESRQFSLCVLSESLSKQSIRTIQNE